MRLVSQNCVRIMQYATFYRHLGVSSASDRGRFTTIFPSVQQLVQLTHFGTSFFSVQGFSVLCSFAALSSSLFVLLVFLVLSCFFCLFRVLFGGIPLRGICFAFCSVHYDYDAIIGLFPCCYCLFAGGLRVLHEAICSCYDSLVALRG